MGRTVAKHQGKKRSFTIHHARGQKAYRAFITFLAVFVFSFISASILAPVRPSDAQEVEIKNNLTGYYVRISNPDTVSLTVDASPTGSLATASSTVNVKTNATSGYQLYISSSATDIYESEDTEHSGAHLSAVSGDLADKAKLSQNTWGFTLDDASTSEKASAAIWSAVPDDSTELIEETSSANYDTGVDTELYFGVNANTRLGGGTYATTIYYTAVAEGATEPFMQDFTTADCSAMTTDSTVRLMDTRNTNIYTIVKARDGNCWMADNLQIDDTTIYAEDSNIPSGSFYVPKSSDWSGNVYDEAKLHIATNSGYEGEHYYNWCSAVAMNDCSTTEQVNQSICPKRWRLPINGDTNQDKSYAKLMSAYGVSSGANLANPSHASYILGFTRYYGSWYHVNASEYLQGSDGAFWSSTPASGTNVYRLYYYPSGINPRYSSEKGYGFSLRCVFEGETIQDITYMQDMTKGICDATNTGVTARLRDKRGRGNAGSAEDDSYGVIKAKDGNCWMTESFDLYNTANSSVQLTSDNTDIPAGSDGSVSTYTLPASSNGNQYTAPLVHQATTSGYTDQIYYNWCAATATSNSTNPNCNATSQVDQSICPKGWQLPIEGSSSVNKTFQKFFGSYDIYAGPALVANSTLGFSYSGFFYGSEGGQGGTGAFWTSSPVSESYAYHINYSPSSNIEYSVARDGKGWGYSVRCVSRD